MPKIWLILKKKQKKFFLFLLFLMILSAALEVIGIGLLFPILGFLSSDNIPKFFLSNLLIFNFDSKVKITIFFLLLFLFLIYLKNIFLLFFSWQEASFISNARELLSIRLFNKYIKKDYSFHIIHNSSIFLSRITNEISTFSASLLAYMTILSEFLILIFISTFLVFIEPIGSLLIFFIMSLFSIIFYYFISGRLKKIGMDRTVYERLRIQKIQESLGGIREIKLFDKEDYFITDYSSVAKKNLYIGIYYQFFNKLPKLFFETVVLSITVFLFIFLLIQDSENNVLISKVGIFVIAAFKLIPSINKIMNSFQIIKYSTTSVKLIANEIDDNQSVQSNDFNKTITFRRSILFKEVNFRHHTKEDFLFENINCEIKFGDVIGVVGPTGSGKSTFIDLLVGFQKPTTGKVLVDNIPLLSIYDWNIKIGYVSQSVFLFDNSILANIILDDDHKNLDLINLKKCLKIAQLEEYTNSLTDGIHTVIGEKGVRLSGGQKQRIGIARALYANPDLIILDEASNALDDKTEQDFFNSLFSLMKNKTIILVTHKKELLKYCNRKIFINKNSVYEKL
jgi:ABC-type multidrug transport system fused ATPase/permease subunit